MDLHDRVFDNLNNALANGYFDPGEQLHGATAYDIACDMIAFAADLEDLDDPEKLIPLIKEWAAVKQITLRTL
jgi:hypothetical protein